MILFSVDRFGDTAVPRTTETDLNRLNALESDSIFIIREAFSRVKPLAMLWSLGKDSNVLMWLVGKAFFGQIPFPTILLDTGNELDEVYAFRDRYVKEWNLTYINADCPPIEETDASLPPMARAAARKTLGLKRLIEQRGFRGILLGIRRDEQAIRRKERIFSPRDATGQWDFRHQPPEFWDQYKSDVPNNAHIRIHPLLAWTELDIWRYIERENIPVVPLYFAKAGKRYRSLGEKDITFPIASNASTIAEIIAELETTREPERAGRGTDHEREDAFEALRSSGYM
jgi:sulfate adenylyltransferase subunit 2